MMRFFVILAQRLIKSYHQITLCRTEVLLRQFEQYWNNLREIVSKDINYLMIEAQNSLEDRTNQTNHKLNVIAEELLKKYGMVPMARTSENQGNQEQIKDIDLKGQNMKSTTYTDQQNDFRKESERFEVESGQDFIRWIAVNIIRILLENQQSIFGQRKDQYTIQQKDKISKYQKPILNNNLNTTIIDNPININSTSSQQLQLISQNNQLDSYQANKLQSSNVQTEFNLIGSKQWRDGEKIQFTIPRLIPNFPEKVRVNLVREKLGQMRRRYAAGLMENDFYEENVDYQGEQSWVKEKNNSELESEFENQELQTKEVKQQMKYKQKDLNIMKKSINLMKKQNRTQESLKKIRYLFNEKHMNAIIEKAILMILNKNIMLQYNFTGANYLQNLLLQQEMMVGSYLGVTPDIDYTKKNTKEIAEIRNMSKTQTSIPQRAQSAQQRSRLVNTFKPNKTFK